MNDSTHVEEILRGSLRDAADHAPLAPQVPVADVLAPVTPTPITAARHRRPRVLVAACVVAIAVACIGVALARGDDSTVRVSSPTAGHAVPVAGLDHSDLELFMMIQATDGQLAAMRAQLDASPDVDRYAFLDHDAAYREFAALFACDPNLVHSIQPTDLPESFRVVATSPEAVRGLQNALTSMPGVESSEAPGGPHTRADTECPEPTLPAAGEPPADALAARDAVVAAFTQAWDGASTFEQRRAAMEDFRDTDVLVDEFDQARAGKGAMLAVVDDIAFLTPERAAVLFHLEFQGVSEPVESGEAVLQDGRWKVSRETVCGMAQRVGVTCSG